MFKKSAGFTLIELLVVIAIIGVLAALLLPALQGVSMASQRAEIKTNITGLAQALAQFHADQSSYPPSLNQGKQDGTSGYFDGALVRFLDGDTGNDEDTKKIKEQYFEFPIDNLITQNGLPLEENPTEKFPVFVSRFETAYLYKNLETQTGRTFGGNQDPRVDVVSFGHFQIYCPAEDVNREDVANWITNYRDLSKR